MNRRWAVDFRSPWADLLRAPTAAEVRAAQLAAAAAATDPDDLRDLLEVLGINGPAAEIAAGFCEAAAA